MNSAEHYSLKIRAAIREAREAGVNVTLDYEEDAEGVHVSLFTSVHRWNDDEYRMDWIEGPYRVEGF